MKLSSKEIQQQYDGFLQTNYLWKNNAVFGLKQFEIDRISSKINIEIDEKLRLGKYIERFVSFQLQQENSIKIIAENVQIQYNRRTLGELDCLLLKEKKQIHLEIIYKFYLYDASVGTTEIEHFIGPNRKDSLVDKLKKLKEKQLPLLYSNHCKPYLEKVNFEVNKTEQQVYFKAQLFVPYSNQNIKLKELNNNCVVGFYINRLELKYFKDYKFYIPNKKDWLIKPNINVDWLSFNSFNPLAEEYFAREFSLLIWVKKSNGIISKLFLVWW